MTVLVPATLAAPLVHTGPPDEATQLAEERTGKAAWEPQLWSDLRDGGPVALGGSEIFAVCDGRAPTVDEAIKAFRGAVLYADPDLPERLEAAQRAVACGGATPEKLARLAFLAGVAASDAGKDEEATSWFQTARSWEPTLSFDTDFPSALAPTFEAAVPSDTRFQLRVLPAENVSLNGAAPTSVPAGVHVVGIGDRGFWIRTGRFAETVIWPDALGPDLAVEKEDERAAVTQVVSVKLGEGQPFGLVAGDVVWTGTSGRTDWKAYRPAPVPTVAPELIPTPQPKRGKLGPVLLTALGVGVAGIGGAVAGEAWHPAGVEEHDAGAHDRAKGRYWLGWGGVAGGSAIAGGGLVWMVAQ